jgi:alpha-galactosidase
MRLYYSFCVHASEIISKLSNKAKFTPKRVIILLTGLLAGLTWLAVADAAAQAQELSNDTIRLRLAVSSDGIPVIKDATLKTKNVTLLSDLGLPGGLENWVPASLIPTAPLGTPVWTISDSENFSVAEASVDLARKMRLIWVVELAKQGHLIRLHTRLQNLAKAPQNIDWFPIWSANWSHPDSAALKARTWQALRYTRVEQSLSPGDSVSVGSQLHSSDVAADGSGSAPYWEFLGPHGRVYFGLEWSGGWSATLGGVPGGYSFSAQLPPSETQLTLGRREAIDGPVLWVTPTAEPNEFFGRNLWMRQRQTIADSLYGGPAPSFPLAYNTWYAARFAVDSNFVRRQVNALAPYSFDAFVVDAGWSSEIGVWKPDRGKFPADVLSTTFSNLRALGIKPGLWSCPQYISPEGDLAPAAADFPPLFSDFLGAYLADLVGDNFAQLLPNHVRNLRRKYDADWWKYDQAFFTNQSRAGVMRNVLAFQDGLRAVRAANSDLMIENCQSGGRMINELTLMTTQASWLLDDPANGLPHARENVQITLGALDFVFPWSAYRFTNNFDRMDPNDDELTRMYCRSAMLGTWGISSDLALISPRQQAIILNEVGNYRQLAQIKTSCFYDIRPAIDGADSAGATFYDDKRQTAAILLYRWDRSGAFDQPVILSRMRAAGTYQITDADTGVSVQVLGKDLMTTGVTVSFSDTRLSALVFVKQVN